MMKDRRNEMLQYQATDEITADIQDTEPAQWH